MRSKRAPEPLASGALFAVLAPVGLLVGACSAVIGLDAVDRVSCTDCGVVAVVTDAAMVDAVRGLPDASAASGHKDASGSGSGSGKLPPRDAAGSGSDSGRATDGSLLIDTAPPREAAIPDTATPKSDAAPVCSATSCGAGEVCHEGGCVAGCDIGGLFVATGAADPSNPCQSCQPASTVSAWTSLGVGASCGSTEVCSAGSCISGCFIGGAIVMSGALNPANDCQACEPTSGTMAWASVPDGAACTSGIPIGGGGTCQAGLCTAQGAGR